MTYNKELEGAAKSYAKIPLNRNIDTEERYFNDSVRKYDVFIDGAKWQSERMYSDEDMISFGKYLLELSNSIMSRRLNMKMLDLETGLKLTKDLFEQYKKKQV